MYKITRNTLDGPVITPVEQLDEAVARFVTMAPMPLDGERVKDALACIRVYIFVCCGYSMMIQHIQ